MTARCQERRGSELKYLTVAGMAVLTCEGEKCHRLFASADFLVKKSGDSSGDQRPTNGFKVVPEQRDDGFAGQRELVPPTLRAA